MDKLAQVLTKYRTSTPIVSGLNSHMMKLHQLISAQFLKIKSLYLRKLKAVFNKHGLFLFTLNYKNYTVFFFYGNPSGRYV